MNKGKTGEKQIHKTKKRGPHKGVSNRFNQKEAITTGSEQNNTCLNLGKATKTQPLGDSVNSNACCVEAIATHIE